MAKITIVSPGQIKMLSESLREKSLRVSENLGRNVNGLELAVKYFRSLSQQQAARELESLKQKDPNLAYKIQTKLRVMSDLLAYNKISLQKLLLEVPNETLCLALRGESVELVEKIQSCLSSSRCDDLQDSLLHGPKVEISKVSEAQKYIFQCVDRLSESGVEF